MKLLQSHVKAQLVNVSISSVTNIFPYIHGTEADIFRGCHSSEEETSEFRILPVTSGISHTQKKFLPCISKLT